MPNFVHGEMAHTTNNNVACDVGDNGETKDVKISTVKMILSYKMNLKGEN